MQRARENAGDGKGKLHVFRREKADYIDEVLREIADRGPLAASELSNGGERRGAWWGWNDGKLAVEWLFFAGLVTTATRRGTFERVYDLTERVLPAAVQALPTPSAEEAQRELLRLSARALGVATEFDLRDYFRLGVADTKARLAELVEAGDLLPVSRRRLEEARLSRPGSAPAARGRGARPAGAVRSADLGARPHRSASSTSSIASRSTRRWPSASTATTCCRSCWATGWWRGSTSRPTAPTRSCWSMPPISSRATTPRKSPDRCARSCG